MHCVLFIGAPASGKSTFYQRRFFRTHLRINLDMVRTRRRERILVDACLAARLAFVVDNTNPTPSDRARYLVPARAAGFTTVGYCFDCRLHECLERNAHRSGNECIPDAAVRAIHRRLIPPDPEEGFDELYRVTLDGHGGFIVTPWPDAATPPLPPQRMP